MNVGGRETDGDRAAGGFLFPLTSQEFLVEEQEENKDTDGKENYH